MLGGVAPVLIYSFKKNLWDDIKGASFLKDEDRIRYNINVPLLPRIKGSIPFPPIPIYLNENITGLYVESEQKTIDIATKTTQPVDSEAKDIEQSPLTSTITINMFANKGNPLLTVLSAFAEQIFRKATTREYSLTYISRHHTVFNGLLSEFTVDQSREDSRVYILMKIIKTDEVKAPEAPEIKVPQLSPEGTFDL